ncbi:MAG: hypothetical protein QGI68_13390 [Pseudomonadales bacterium]|nr:hypothetical protein [Pseudomonadales bacterium]MDP7357567.1 hypothetical protein [Pseudomonadales bacterium]MDP7596545.1 hypothetical protein [Pseudomonadales bacterium]HJN51070.1 hypothetical protein [Pseudomonadales bacterium]
MKIPARFAAIMAVVMLVGCGGSDPGSSPVSSERTVVPPPAPEPITLTGSLMDGPVVGGHVFVFFADDIQAVLDAADAADDRLTSLRDAAAVASLARVTETEGIYTLRVSADHAGRAVFVVFDNTDSEDTTFLDRPFNMESVTVLSDAGTTSRVNITPQASMVAAQVRTLLPLDASGVAGAIVTANANVVAAFGEDQIGNELLEDGVDVITLDDVEVLEAASTFMGSLVRSTAAGAGLERDDVLEALALDALDGEVDGTVPAGADVDEDIADRVEAVEEFKSLGEARDEPIVVGSCASTATLLKRACDIDSMDDFLEGVASCQDGDADEEEFADCIADVQEEREETLEECADVHDARDSLCEDLDDAVHEPEFGEDYADNFVDPLEIGVSVEANPYFPLLQGHVWVYESTFIDEDDGEEVTETTTVTVTGQTKLIEGITCLVVNDVVAEDGVLIENTDDWFAQDTDGNVWYCGEIAENFEYFDGDEPELPELVDIEGSWKAGREGAEAGILVPAEPEVGDIIRNEVLYGEAEDVIEILSLQGDESVQQADCNGSCLVVKESTPLEPDAEENTYYLPGMGVILEVDVETGARAELISFSRAPVEG